MLTDSLCNSRCVCEEMNQPMRMSECGVQCWKWLLIHAMGMSTGVTSCSPQHWDPSFYTLRKQPPKYITPQLLVSTRLPYSLYYYLYLFVFSTVLLLSLLFINTWKLGNFTVITVSWFLFILSVSGGPVQQQELVICHPMHINNVVISIWVWVRSHWKVLWSKESGVSWY